MDDPNTLLDHPLSRVVDELLARCSLLRDERDAARAITAALGDAAIVVSKARLRAALERAWLDGHSAGDTAYLSDERFDAIVAELSGQGVEG